MKTKLFYLALFIVLLCSCEPDFTCECDLPLGEGLPVIVVVEFEKAEYADYIYVAIDEKYNRNEFVNMIPKSLDFDQSPFLHIIGNQYLVNWNWLVSKSFLNLNNNYIIADKWSEYYNIDAIHEKALVKFPIKKIKLISPHTLNHYIEYRNLNIDSIDERYFDFTLISSYFETNELEHQKTDEDWTDFSQNTKDYYLELYNSSNDNFKKIGKTLRYLLQEKNSDKYFIIQPKY
jgi:hypothetical protein